MRLPPPRGPPCQWQGVWSNANHRLRVVRCTQKQKKGVTLFLIVDYVTGAESMQLTRAEFKERGEVERPKLPELIALLSEPVTYTILISIER